MLARVAQAMWATARDLERADGVARLLEAAQAMALEGTSSNGHAGPVVWEPLVRMTGDIDTFLRTHRRADARSVAWALGFDPGHHDSIAQLLVSARESARSVRDRLPVEVWEAINQAGREPAQWPPRRIAREGMYPYCRAIRHHCSQIAGLIDHAMRRDAAWQFMRVGRYVERAQRIAQVAAVAPGPRVDAWLGSADSWPAAALASLAPDGAGPTGTTMLLIDEQTPLSVAFCIGEIVAALDWMVAHRVIAEDPAALVLARAARASLREVDPADAPQLAERLALRVTSIGDSIAEACFSAHHRSRTGQHAQAARQAQN